MSVLSRLNALERRVKDAGAGLLGMAERMRVQRSVWNAAGAVPRRPKTRAEIMECIAKAAPGSLAYRMNSQALMNMNRKSGGIQE